MMTSLNLTNETHNYTDVYSNTSVLETEEDSMFSWVERTGHGIIVPCIAGIGIILNICNLVILSRPIFKESSYTYLSSLALADFLSLCFFFTNSIGRGHYPHDKRWRAFEVYVYFPCGSSTTTASVLLTVAVTVERFVFIYHPAQSKTWCRQTIARRICAAVWLFSTVINIPRFFIMTVGGDGRLAYTAFGLSGFYRYLSWAYFFVISLGAGLCLLILNVLLACGVRKTNTRRRLMQSRSVPNDGQVVKDTASVRERQREREEAVLTRTLIAVVCVFILGETPSSFTSRWMVTALLGNTTVLVSVGYRLAVLVSTVLVVSQHSLNFVVYCLFNRRFCEAFSKQSVICRKNKLMSRISTAD